MSMTPEIPGVRPPKKSIGTRTQGGWVMALVAASVALLVVLGLAGVVTTQAPSGDQYAPMTTLPARPLTASPCSATTPTGTTFDPCTAERYAYWVAEFWTPINADNFTAKWKASNPGEWARLETFRKDGLAFNPATDYTQITVNTQRGRVLWAIIIQCKAWVNDPHTCATP